MLLCLKCKDEKPFDEFYVKRDRPRGYQSYCKVCARKRTNQHRAENQKTLQEKQREYYKNNSEKRVASVLKARKNHWDKFVEYKKQYTHKNLEKVRAWDAAKRANRLQRTPMWLSVDQKKEIENFYWLAKDLEVISGQSYHVDHIVPLSGKTVCGLHVPWNLQVLPADVNCRKSNKFNGMPQ